MSEKEEPKKQLNKKGKDIFDWWNQKASIKDGDQFPTVMKKVAIRISGILLFLLFSPLLLVIFIFVVAVSL